MNILNLYHDNTEKVSAMRDFCILNETTIDIITENRVLMKNGTIIFFIVMRDSYSLNQIRGINYSIVNMSERVSLTYLQYTEIKSRIR